MLSGTHQPGPFHVFDWVLRISIGLEDNAEGAALAEQLRASRSEPLQTCASCRPQLRNNEHALLFTAKLAAKHELTLARRHCGADRLAVEEDTA